MKRNHLNPSMLGYSPQPRNRNTLCLSWRVEIVPMYNRMALAIANAWNWKSQGWWNSPGTHMCARTYKHKGKKKKAHVQSKTDLISQEWQWWHGPLTLASFEGTAMALELVPSRALWRFTCSKCIWMPGLAVSRAEFHLRLILLSAVRCLGPFLPGSLEQLPVGWSSGQIECSRVHQELTASRRERQKAIVNTRGLWSLPLFLIQQSQTNLSIYRKRSVCKTAKYGSEG